MPSYRGKTIHHCPGKTKSYGSLTAGGCYKPDGQRHCDKHQMLCPKHYWVYHLRTEQCPRCKDDAKTERNKELFKRDQDRTKAAKDELEKPEWYLDDSKDRTKPRHKKGDGDGESGADGAGNGGAANGVTA